MRYKQFLMLGLALVAGAVVGQQGDSAQPQRLRVSEEGMSGILIRKVEPQYPTEARAKRIVGQVLLSVIIDKQGQVRDVTPIQKDWSGREAINADDPLVRAAAVEAVKQWRYFSYELNGDPIEVETSVLLQFDFTHEQAQAPAKMRVSRSVMEANLLHKVDPHYPAEARNKHIHGDVILLATISKEGNITELKVVSGHPLLADAAREAVKQWKYTPFTLNGRPVEVETVITVRFEM